MKNLVQFISEAKSKTSFDKEINNLEQWDFVYDKSGKGELVYDIIKHKKDEYLDIRLNYDPKIRIIITNTNKKFDTLSMIIDNNKSYIGYNNYRTTSSKDLNNFWELMYRKRYKYYEICSDLESLGKTFHM